MYVQCTFVYSNKIELLKLNRNMFWTEQEEIKCSLVLVNNFRGDGWGREGAVFIKKIVG